MGYTHCFHGSGEQEINPAALEIITPLLDQGFKDKIIAEEYDRPDTPPYVSKTAIKFNGVGDNGHETFAFHIGDTGFGFCKTARKPYDVFVCKVLLTIKHFHPNIEMSSDGDDEPEMWREAREWFDDKLSEI